MVSNGSIQGQTGLTYHFLFFDIHALWRSVVSTRVPECQRAKSGALDQYDTERFGRLIFCHNQKKCGTERVKQWRSTQQPSRDTKDQFSTFSTDHWDQWTIKVLKIVCCFHVSDMWHSFACVILISKLVIHISFRDNAFLAKCNRTLTQSLHRELFNFCHNTTHVMNRYIPSRLGSTRSSEMHDEETYRLTPAQKFMN